jgi:hypothetical protein
MNNKIKNIDAELTRCEAKLLECQKAKLTKTNQLIVSYPLGLSQMEYLIKANNKSRLQ